MIALIQVTVALIATVIFTIGLALTMYGLAVSTHRYTLGGIITILALFTFLNLAAF